MKVVINAQLDPVRSGGIAQVIMGLAHGLGRLNGSEEYLFVCSPDSAEWLSPYLGENSRIAVNKLRTPSPVFGVRCGMPVTAHGSGTRLGAGWSRTAATRAARR